MTQKFHSEGQTMHDTGQDEKAAGGASEGKRARAVTGYSGRSTVSTTGYAAKRWIDPPATDRVTIDLAAQPKRWSDDPWCNMTTGEEEAWRRGVRDALYVAAEEAADREGGCFTEMLIRRALERLAGGEKMPDEGSDEDWPALRVLFAAIASMEPPS